VAVESGEQYCRAIEAYLCRKNDGHLIRVVGPAFEQVLGWESKGVPLKIAFHGIDRYFERYYAKGPRRRPIRIEFCEADVLDAFDEWRRAVGVIGDARSGIVDAAESSDDAQHRQGSLPAHLERVIARLTTIRAGSEPEMDAVLDAIVRELDGYRARAKSLRGEARQQFLVRLRDLDAELLATARRLCDASTLHALHAEADQELAPFRSRLSSDAFIAALQAALDRLIRERLRLPVVSFD
jgi:hypothetical protein